MKVFNSDNVKLGILDNLIIDGHTGQVLYGILDTGLTGKLIPVPWNALQITKSVENGRYSLLLNSTPERLAKGPTFNKHQWPNFLDAQWKHERGPLLRCADGGPAHGFPVRLDPRAAVGRAAMAVGNGLRAVPGRISGTARRPFPTGCGLKGLRLIKPRACVGLAGRL